MSAILLTGGVLDPRAGDSVPGEVVDLEKQRLVVAGWLHTGR
jgi:hypothetical protein